MNPADMNTADCKAIIVDMMNSLVGSMDIVEKMAALKDGLDLHELTLEKFWKRASKMKLPNGAQRTFQHKSGAITVCISNTIDQDGNGVVEVEMKDVPAVFQRAIDASKNLTLPGGHQATRNDPSMLLGEKPEGFGMFS